MVNNEIKGSRLYSEKFYEKSLALGRESYKRKVIQKNRPYFITDKLKNIFKNGRKKLINEVSGTNGVMLISIIPVIIIFLTILFSSAFYTFGDSSADGFIPVSSEVEAYTSVMEKYAKERDIGEYIELIKAVMMQESKGKGTDPMGSSGCPYNKKYSGKIKNSEYSIRCGVYYLADCMKKAKVKNPIDMENIKLSLQGYNYGLRYISWAIKKDNGYTLENASRYSVLMAKKKGSKSYGDKNYVSHVLRYYPYGSYTFSIGSSNIVKVAENQLGNSGGRKFWSWYGFRARTSWCACFVSWCANQCGYTKAGIIPKFSYAPNGMSWFKKKGQFRKSGYTPRSGDIIFFDWDGNGTPNHVGIVTAVEKGHVKTVEGNSSDAVRNRRYILGSSCILGYGVPKY